MGWGRKATGLVKEEEGCGSGQGKGQGEQGDTRRVTRTFGGYSSLGVGSAGSSGGVEQRTDVLSTQSGAGCWQGSCCGVLQLGTAPGERGTPQEEEESWGGSQGRGSGGGRRCWSNAGGSEATPVLHTAASWGCPFSLTTGTGIHVPAKPPVLGTEILQGLILQFIPVHPRNDRE